MASRLEKLIHALIAQQQMVATAESCTGGGLSQALTAIAGSSACFDRGYITYQNSAKAEMLGVTSHTLAEHGAVSKACAEEMALGTLVHSDATIAIAITGIAGPDGGSVAKPVGTVCFAWLKRGQAPQSCRQQFSGNRTEIRQQAIDFAIETLLDLIAI